jgi:hypothetical protein
MEITDGVETATSATAYNASRHTINRLARVTATRGAAATNDGDGGGCYYGDGESLFGG